MNSKVANFLVLACLVVGAGIYLFHTAAIPYQPTGRTLGPKYFPNALGVALIVLCLVAAYREWRTEAERIAIAHRREIAATVVLTVLYILTWQLVGYFYVVTAVFFVLLVLAYSKERFRVKHVSFVIVLGAFFSVLLYVSFGLALGAKFY